MNKQQPMSDLSFKGMSLWLSLRERFRDIGAELRASGLEEGQVVLDFGCGIGSYSIPAGRIVGDEGVVYAVDIHPSAIQAVEKRARGADLTNIKTILSDTGILSDAGTTLPGGSVDFVLLFDVLHSVPGKHALLAELARVLRPDGILLVKPDHMGKDELLETVQAANLFSLNREREDSFEFRRLASAGQLAASD